MVILICSVRCALLFAAVLSSLLREVLTQPFLYLFRVLACNIMLETCFTLIALQKNACGIGLNAGLIPATYSDLACTGS